MTQILFLVNGLGLGNSTRCHAIIERLAGYDARVTVMTSENGLWYFASRDDVDRLEEMEPFHYGKREDGQLSVAATFASIAHFIGVQRRNADRLRHLMDEIKPALVVTDSVYLYGPVRERGVPLAALNNADVVCRAWRLFRDRPSSIRAQFYAVEFSDYLVHRWKPRLVISPTLTPELGAPTGAHYMAVPPIVRRGYEPADASNNPPVVTVMLSGSNFGTNVVFDKPSYPFSVRVVGRDAPTGWTGHGQVEYFSRVRDTMPHMRDADLLVVNGGFSAVSEAYAMKKPVIVVPVPNHAEQWVNARTIEHLGVGLMSGESDIEQKIFEAIGRLDELRGAYDRLPWRADGAVVAAERLLQVAKGHA